MVTKLKMEKKLSEESWRAIGKKLFGTDDIKQWVFKCPSCGVSTKGQEWVDADAKDMFAFSCIGRTLEEKGEFLKNKKQPCNYAGGGLFALNPVKLVHADGQEAAFFEFDHPDFELEVNNEFQNDKN